MTNKRQQMYDNLINFATNGEFIKMTTQSKKPVPVKPDKWVQFDMAELARLVVLRLKPTAEQLRKSYTREKLIALLEKKQIL